MCKKGYQYTDYTVNIDSITRNKKDIAKKPSVFGVVAEFSKSYLNFFFYTYNTHSILKKGNIIGNKLFYNSELIDWDFLDNFKIELADKTCKMIRLGTTAYEGFKKNGFCLSFIIYKEKGKTYSENIFDEWLEAINADLGRHENELGTLVNGRS